MTQSGRSLDPEFLNATPVVPPDATPSGSIGGTRRVEGGESSFSIKYVETGIERGRLRESGGL